MEVLSGEQITEANLTDWHVHGGPPSTPSSSGVASAVVMEIDECAVGLGEGDRTGQVEVGVVEPGVAEVNPVEYSAAKVGSPERGGPHRGTRQIAVTQNCVI